MRRLAGSLLGVLLLVLSACGGSGTLSETAGPESTVSSTVDTTTPEAPSTTQAATTTAARPRVTLPAGGPRGPVDPPDTPAYELLTSGPDGCRQLLSIIERDWPLASPNASGIEPRLFYLYRGAANACLLRWAAAKADFDRLQALRPAPTFANTCSSDEVRECERCHRLVLAWLTGQLEAFGRDPSYMPTFTRSTGRSPCPAAASTTTSTTRAVATTTTVRR